MDTIKSILPGIIGLIGSLVGGGPLGLIAFGIGSIGLIIGGVVLYNKYKGMIFKQAEQQQIKDGVKDAQDLIVKNQKQGADDSKTFQESEKDRDEAKKKFNGPA